MFFSKEKFLWVGLASVLVLTTINGCIFHSRFNALSEQELIAQQLEEQKAMAVSLYVDATMLNDLSEHQDALKKLDLAVELDPQFAIAYSMKGDIYQKLQDYSQSADSYEKATELDPWSFKDFFNLGKVCLIIKEYARAAKAYVNACRLDPNHFDSHINAAKCYLELKEYESSLEYADKAKQINPSAGEVEAVLGDIYHAQKNHADAINSYRRALEMQGNKPEIMVPLAVEYLRTGRYTAAKELLTDVISIDPQNGMAHQYLGFAQLKLKEVDLAIENYKTAVKIDDKDWMAHKGLGVAYMMQSLKNNNDEKIKILAIEQWNISLGLNADQPELTTLLEKYQSK